MVLAGNPRSLETSKKITTLGCLNLHCPVVWVSGVVQLMAYVTLLCCVPGICSLEVAGSGLGWGCWLEPLTGLLRSCSRSA